MELSESSDEETITIVKVPQETSPQGICLGIVDELIDLVVDSIQDFDFEDKKRVATVSAGQLQHQITKVEKDRLKSTIQP